MAHGSPRIARNEVYQLGGRWSEAKDAQLKVQKTLPTPVPASRLFMSLLASDRSAPPLLKLGVHCSQLWVHGLQLFLGGLQFPRWCSGGTPP